MKAFIALILGIAIGAAALWFFNTREGQATLKNTGQQIEEVAKPALDKVQEQVKALRLEPQDIKDELARSGQVVRRKAEEAGQNIASATADARITATIKAKLVAEPNLSALNISVNTTSGLVTLAGSVDSPEKIGRAMAIAMQVEGVREVVSTLQVHLQPAKNKK